ncbi:MAG: hydroxyphenylacetyl-CoA thioesterase PaaI [Panacagrimonas sp.]
MSETKGLAADPAVDLARRVGQSMFERDTASQGLGMRIEDIGPGSARLSMVVRADMLNGHHICHGGFMFTLADSAFAFACNSRNEATVAAGCSIEFLRPVQIGETLTATAQERVLSGRTGIYDITLTDSAGQPVALFRGKSARIKGEVLPPH